MSEMKEKMHTGELYLPGDEEIMKEQVVYQDKLCDYNLTKPSEAEKRMEMLKDMLGDCGEGRLFMQTSEVIIVILEIWFMQIII